MNEQDRARQITEDLLMTILLGTPADAQSVAIVADEAVRILDRLTHDIESSKLEGGPRATETLANARFLLVRAMKELRLEEVKR